MSFPQISGTHCQVFDSGNSPLSPLELPPAGFSGFSITGENSLVLRSNDWTPRYLLVGLRLRSEVCGMLRLRVYAKTEGEPFMIQLGLLPGVRARLSLDLNILDGQSVFLRRHPGLLKGVAFGRRIARHEIQRIELSLDDNAQSRELFLQTPSLSDIDSPWIEPGAPQADLLGQWTAREWPGKIQGEAELRSKLQAAAAEAPAEWPENWSACGGSRAFRFKATGWFRTEHDGRRWWLVDPEGYGFWSAGLDCVRPGVECSVVPGTEPLFTWLPSSDPAYADAIRPPRNGIPSVDFGVANLRRAFGDDWKQSWAALTASRLRTWRFNTVGNWSDPEIGPQHRVPWVMPMPAYPSTEIKLFRDLPDVFDPAFAANAATWAEFLRPFREDRWLIGYFMDNEPHWGFGKFNLASEMLEANPGTHSRKALADWLRQRYADDVQALAQAWNLPLAGFDDLVTGCFRRADEASPTAGEDLWAFSAELVRAHARIPAEACRAVDPHHLNLGLRWAWIASDLFYESAACCDVFSVNCYQMLPDAEEFSTFAERSGRPVLIGEWHMGATDRGLPSTGLRRTANQDERGKAYAAYLEAAAAHPGVIGAHWFTLNDQSLLGRFDGENYQIGFVDGCHMPYPEICAAAIATHEKLYDLVSGKIPPTEIRAIELPRIAF